MNELEFVRSELGAMGPTPVCCSAESPVDLMCCLVKIVFKDGKAYFTFVRC
jgi:hypothetical protein